MNVLTIKAVIRSLDPTSAQTIHRINPSISFEVIIKLSAVSQLEIKSLEKQTT